MMKASWQLLVQLPEKARPWSACMLFCAVISFLAKAGTAMVSMHAVLCIDKFHGQGLVLRHCMLCVLCSLVLSLS